MRVRWSKRANAALQNAADYIAADNPRAAADVYEEIIVQADRLGQYPAIGRNGRSAGTRELVINRTPYLLVYRIENSGVLILRLLHGARRWPPKR